MTEDSLNNPKSVVSHQLTDDHLSFFQKLPAKERLRWLEEAQEFMFKILPAEKWEIMQKFRRREI